MSERERAGVERAGVEGMSAREGEQKKESGRGRERKGERRGEREKK